MGTCGQRILLARTLYRRPRLSFMDEGTSHLGIATERQVTAAEREHRGGDMLGRAEADDRVLDAQ